MEDEVGDDVEVDALLETLLDDDDPTDVVDGVVVRTVTVEDGVGEEVDVDTGAEVEVVAILAMVGVEVVAMDVGIVVDV